MKLSGKDRLFAAGIAIVLALLLFGTGRNKPKRVPADARHQPVLARLAQGVDRGAVELECAACHSPRNNPLPAKHPPKEQCLLCHEKQE